MPIVVRTVTALKDNADVAFVGLCIPEATTPPKIKTIVPACSKIAEKKQLNYPNFIWSGDADPLTSKFNITGTPYNCLMSADGKVLATLEIPEGDPEKAYKYLMDAIASALKIPLHPPPRQKPASLRCSRSRRAPGREKVSQFMGRPDCYRDPAPQLRHPSRRSLPRATSP